MHLAVILGWIIKVGVRRAGRQAWVYLFRSDTTIKDGIRISVQLLPHGVISYLYMNNDITPITPNMRQSILLDFYCKPLILIALNLLTFFRPP